MEPKEINRYNGTKMALPEIRCAGLTIPELIDQLKLDSSIGSFYIGTWSEIDWFFELIRSSQNSSTLERETLQFWSIHRVGNGILQILCRNEANEILIARVIKRKFPFTELMLSYVKNSHFEKPQRIDNQYKRKISPDE